MANIFNHYQPIFRFVFWLLCFFLPWTFRKSDKKLLMILCFVSAQIQMFIWYFTQFEFHLFENATIKWKTVISNRIFAMTPTWFVRSCAVTALLIHAIHFNWKIKRNKWQRIKYVNEKRYLYRSRGIFFSLLLSIFIIHIKLCRTFEKHFDLCHHHSVNGDRQINQILTILFNSAIFRTKNIIIFIDLILNSIEILK